MTGVKNQKWWGWGDEGTAYSIDNKPKFKPFVRDVIGVDVDSVPVKKPRFEDLDVPACELGDALKQSLTDAVGAANLFVDDEVRVAHCYGKGVRDLLRLRQGILGRIPDVVVYPGTEDEVIAVADAVIAADGVLIPYGGGSNIVAALEAVPGETRQVVSVDMGRLNKVLEIDEVSGLARIQAGTYGPDMEKQLNARGWTLGHFPDSFIWSTVGGWVATRSSGNQSDKYGDIADVTRGMRVVMPSATAADRVPGQCTQVLHLNPLPSSSSGPSVREMLIGSEGRLGIITEVSMNVHRIAEAKEIQAYFFPNYDAGLEFAEAVCHSDASPVMLRVSDANETKFSMANASGGKSKISQYVNKAVQKIMVSKGWDLDQICMSFIGFEGSPANVRFQKGLVGQLVRKHGGMGVGKGPGSMYDEKKFDIPYIRDFLLDLGIPADVSETTSTWANAKTMHDETVKRAEEAFAKTGHKGFIMCHVSHSYHIGACQYFTFAIADSNPETVFESYDAVKQAVQQSFMDLKGTVSHHHGVGEEHSPWMAQDISEAGVHVQKVLFEGVDPGHNLNPGKIIHEGVPGVSSNSKQPE
ncbi:FAD-binding oxidoreductase [Propionibacteriaceae bacterium G1746]|uniref:FAD-binding oxidoreductase n=1 Tax=Aestuariimicrobium sp. G57 TaxID=3418485 RepID=UPI003C25250B